MLALATTLAAAKEESSNFLVSPSGGLMLWTLLAFGVTILVLNKLAFPRIREALDKRAAMIQDSIDAAEQFERETAEQSRERRAELLAQTEKDIEAEKRRAIEDIRSEVADLTIAATEKVTGRVLTGDDQRRLVDEALADLDFSAISGDRDN